MYDKIFEKDNDAKNYFQKIDFNSTIEEIRDLLNNAALLKMPAPSSDIINLDQFNVILEKINNISSISDAKNARIIVNNFKTALKKYGVEYNETLSFKNAYYGYNEFIESKYLTKGFVNYMKEKCNINIDPVDLIKKRKKANIKMGITLTVFYTIYILIVAPLVMMLF